MFPAVRSKISLIGREDSTVPQVLRENYERGVGQVHRQIRILFHEPANTCRVVISKLEYIERAITVSINQFLLCGIAKMLQ